MRSSRRAETIARWGSTLAVLAVASAIFVLTAQNPEASSALSVSVSDAVLGAAEAVEPESVQPTASLVKFVPGAVVFQPLGLGIGLRQLAHTAEFLALGVPTAVAARLWARRLLGWRDEARRCAYAAALGACAAWSLLDQVHKLFVPGREFDAVDLGFDAFGYAMALALVALVDAVVARQRSMKEVGRCA